MKTGLIYMVRQGGKLAVASAAALLLSSCAVVDWFAGKTSDAEVQQMDKDLGQATKKQTAYDESLKKFGRMLEAYNIGEIKVQSKVIANQTAEKELPDSVSNMLISAVNKIGKTVVYIPYDPSYVINEANTGGNINRALPQVVLAGGITEFDKDMIEKGRELKTEVSIAKDDFGSKYSHDGGAGYQAETGVSRIAMDLQLLNYKTQTYLPNIQSISQINLRKSKLGWSVGYYFQGSGMAFQYSLSKKQGKYHALRLLVEISVIEVLGKYFDVPYWRCVDGMTVDAQMVNRLKEEFGGLSENQQDSYLKEYLFFHGYDGFSRSTAGMTPAEQDLLKKAMQKFQCTDRAELFVKLWETVPIDSARVRNRDYARDAAKRQQQAENEMQQKVGNYNSLITKADALYKGGSLAEARDLYRQANAIFPDQKDPVDMIAKIDQEAAAAKNQAPGTTAPMAPTVPAAPAIAAPTASATAAAPAPAAGQRKKEAPLSPFKTTEW